MQDSVINIGLFLNLAGAIVLAFPLTRKTTKKDDKKLLKLGITLLTFGFFLQILARMFLQN